MSELIENPERDASATLERLCEQRRATNNVCE
jgi:hypothetical protein